LPVGGCEMKRLLLPVFLLSLLIAYPAATADFQKGLDTFDKGDYATALQEWKPLAEQGDAIAQYNLGLMYYNGDGIHQNYISARM